MATYNEDLNSNTRKLYYDKSAQTIISNDFSKFDISLGFKSTKLAYDYVKARKGLCSVQKCPEYASFNSHLCDLHRRRLIC